MLQAMRNKMQGWPSIVVLGIAVFAMSFFGIESYFMSSSDTFVAKVGKHEISQQQYQDRMNQLRQQASSQQGDQFDASVFEKPQMKLSVLNQMVDEVVLDQANSDLGMRVSDQAIRSFIGNIPAFQLNGQFDGTTYRTVLAMQSKSPEMFQSEVRSSLASSLIPDAIAASTIVTGADVDRYLNLRLQRRDVRYLQLPLAKPADSIITQAQVDAYYKEHQADFIRPEQVSLKYVEVSPGDLKPKTAPTEDELKKRYEDEKQRFVQPEQRLVSHILINVPKNASPAQQKKALAEADKIDAEATPANFADLAKKDSDDLGSKRQGGDLGYLQQGIANKAFDEAMFSLKKGQISKPVLSEDGYHIIWLREIKNGVAKPFDEVRTQLVKELTDSDQERAYSELAGKLTDNTYKNPASLESASQELNLPVQTTALFSRAGGAGLAANAKVIKAAFSDDVLVQGNNSSLIELGKDQSAVIRVDKHVAASPKPLSEVHALVEQKILHERTTEASKAQADKLLARLKKGVSMKDVAESVGIKVASVNDVVRSQGTLPPSLDQQAFLLGHPNQGKSTFADVAMPDGSYALLAVDKVQGADMSKVQPQQREMLKQQMAQAYAAEATHEFIEALKSNLDITVAKNRL